MIVEKIVQNKARRRKKMFSIPRRQHTSVQTDIIRNKLRGENGLQLSLSWSTDMTQENKDIVIRAAQILVDVLINPIIHLVEIGTMTTGLGESSTPLVGFNSYSTLRSDYAGTNNFFRESILDKNLPPSDPLSGTHTYFAAVTQCLSWGLAITNAPSQIFINFSQSGYDLVGVALHELTETMGRIGGFDNAGTTYRGLMDLCNFDNAGSRAAPYGANSYYSFDNGVTFVSHFNTNMDGDASDWSGQTVARDCCNAFATKDVIETLSIQDLVVMQGVGFNLAPIEYAAPALQLIQNREVLLLNNYSSILEITTFHITPDLPDALTSATRTGVIIGAPHNVNTAQAFKVSFVSDLQNQEGAFSIEIVANTSSNGLSGGEIAGIVIGVAALIVIIVVASVYATKAKKPKTN